jgi:(S)-2-hydroxyglutarate dehydrogenase
MPERADVVVVGAGIIGLAAAYRLLQLRPGLRLVVLEKEPAVAVHQTGHNSGVIHAGIYYPPGSLKARLCREGKAELEAFADAHGIPYQPLGKVIVAVDEYELGRLDALEQRARANGVEGVECVGSERLRELEPHVTGIRGLYSPRTGVIDFAAVARAYADEVVALGGELRLRTPLVGIDRADGGLRLQTPNGELAASALVACAGLQCDRVAALEGKPPARRIVPFRGGYWELAPSAADLVRGMIYPVPDPALPFLGVHFTRRIDGSVWTGPNAILALGRERYSRLGVTPRDVADMARFRGFWRMMRANVALGAGEVWRELAKRAYLTEARRYVPELRSEDLRRGPSGVRAQLVGPGGELVDDFAVHETERAIHVLNAPSPAATASLAIGRMVAERALARFGDG